MLILRNKDGVAMCLISRSMARNLIKRYVGEWKENSNGNSVYIFRESAMYSNADIGILIYSGCSINVDDRYERG